MPGKRLSGSARGGQRRQRRRLRISQATTILSANETPVPEVDVGGRLRTLREGQGLSIRALAEKSGLAVNTLSLIENGKTSPSVSTLQRVALALEIPITAFFETDAPKKNVVYSKANNRPRATFTHGSLEDLASGLIDCALEPFVVTLEPGTDSGADPIVHTGHEMVFCLRGRLAYTIEEKTYTLETGDSLVFESHLPHRWQNADDKASQAILVLCPADERDRGTERHFTALTGE